jgi:membrane fusion protein, multidrug efflux system
LVKRIVYFLAAAIVLAGSYLSVQALRAPSDKASDRTRSKTSSPRVLTETVKLESTAAAFSAIASAYADKSAEVYAQVDEKVTQVLFRAQQKVRKGQLLVQQDDREEQLALRLAQVQLNSTRGLLERYKQAVGQGAVPQTQVDSAQADYDAAQLAVERAKLAIANHQVRAPFDGVVGISDVDPGQRVGPGVLITGIDSREIMYFDFDVPEALLSQLGNTPPGQIQVAATTPSVPGKRFAARVVALDSRLNNQKRTLRVRANIANPDDLLRPGMSFAVDMKLAGAELPAVPEIALQWDREGSYVWMIREGRAVRENVRVAGRRNALVFLQGNLLADEQVVTEGGLRLSNGVTVEPVQDPLK